MAGGLFNRSAVAEKDSRGNEFWLAFPGNTNAGANQLFLYLVSTGPAVIDVSYAPVALATPFTTQVTFTASGQVQRVDLPATATPYSAAQSADIQANDVIGDKAIHITSTGGSSPFTVYGFSNSAATADAMLGLPVNVLGNRYFVAGYGATNSTAQSGSQFVVVGTQPNTQVTITPTAVIPSSGFTTNLGAGAPYTITLQPGQTYLARGAVGTTDLTGTRIEADQPVAVFSGNRCGNVPVGYGACDILLEQLPPTDAWGESFLTVPHALRTRGDVFRIVAAEDGTQVTINGGTPIALNAGQFYETTLTTASYIQTNAGHPTLVTQYEPSAAFDLADFISSDPLRLQRDPSMSIVCPFEQYLDEYTFSTPTNSGFDNYNFVNIVAPTEITGTLLLDGAVVPSGLWLPIGSTAFSAAQVPITPGVHHAVAERPFGITTYGNATVTTYAYPGGMAVAPIATVKTITLDVTGGTEMVGNQFCGVVATATDANGDPVVGVRVDLTTSLNGDVDYGLTDANGQVTFCYTGHFADLDEITGSVGSVTGINWVLWTPKPVTVSIGADSRYYDGTNAATLNSLVVNDVLPWDVGNVELNVSSATFSDEQSANGKVVTGTGLSLTGSAAYNYTLAMVDVTTNADIWPKQLTPAITADSKQYDGNTTATLSSQTVSGVVPGEEALVSLVVGAANFDTKDVGTGKPVTGTGLSLTGTGASNYVLTATTAATTADITPIPITVTADTLSKVYGDDDPALTYTITSGALLGGDTLTGSLTRVAGDDVGSYAIAQGTLGVSSNYILTFVGANLSITPRPITVTADAKTKTYGDADPALTWNLTSGNLVNSDTLTGSLVRVTGEDVGAYAINQGTLAATANYALTYAGANLTITTRPLTVTADAQTKTYGDTDPALTYSITSGSLAFSDALTGSLVRDLGENVGTYTITQGGLTAGANYAFTYVPANLTITARPLTVTADPQAKTYGDPDPTLTWQLTAGALVGSDAFTGGLDRDPGVNVGVYPITQGTLSAGSNYAVSYVPDNLTIAARPLTVTADPQTKVYGDADPALSYQLTGSLVGGDALSGALARDPGTDVGTYAITQGTLAATGNYTLSFVPASLAITPRPLTVTADAQTKVYGDADPALTYTISSGSLVGPDNISGALVRDPGTDVGVYAISQGTVTAGTNYSLTYVPANFTITPKPITVTADAKTKVYGEADPALTWSITSGTLESGDSLTGDLDRAAGTDVGTYAIGQGTLAASTNYTLTYVGANLTITAKPITVTANAQTKVYGEADPTLTWSITSGTLESGDSLTGDLDRAPGTDVGTYAIGQGTLAASSNYDLTYVGANLTITAKPIEVTANAQTKVYGEADPALTWTITSGTLESGDSLTGDLDRAPGTDVGTYAIGQGTLAASANYALTYVGANLTITAKPITVTANAQTKVYGEADPALTWTITSGTLESGDSLTGDLDRAPGTDVGTYAIGQGTLAASSNYALTYVGANLTITAKPITVTANAQTKVYGEADPTLTWTITSGTLESGDSLTGDLDRAPGTDVGTYAIGQGTLAASSNYALTYVGADLTITAKPITVTANPQTKVYGDADPALTWTITSGTLESGDSLTGDLDRAPGTDVGTYAIGQGTLAASANYALTYVGANLTITAKPIEVTANAQTKVYGEADPALTWTITSGTLESGDSLTGDLDRAPGTDVGTYAINQGTLAASSNYALTYVGADLTITAKPITVTANPQTKVYGDADP
ncbi:MAG: MBG domain-containing protein, partial [Vicinamibacterales bacterium]